MYDHKEEIINTRKGCLGGSDAKMIAQIAETGTIPQSAMKRLAVCKGLIEHEQFTNNAMEFGNFIEDAVFKNLKESNDGWQSNPCLVSKRYSGKNVTVIDHVDFLLQDDEKRTITLGECKATKLTFIQTRDEYKNQLLHHYLLGDELARQLGGYKVVIILAHYNTEGLDLNEPFKFEPERLTVKTLRDMKRLAMGYQLRLGVMIIDQFLETFDSYYEDDEIDANLLPEDVKAQFDRATTLLTEIKAREEEVEAFKSKLYEFMCEKNIKSLKNEEWSIVRVDPTESKTFDHKRYMEDFTKEHPRKAMQIKQKYTKTSKKKGYVTIKLKSKENND